MIKEFDKVWETHHIGEWDEYCEILHKLNIYDNKEILELLKYWAKGIYSFGFSDGHYDAGHAYFKYHTALCKSVTEFMKDIMSINEEKALKDKCLNFVYTLLELSRDDYENEI